MRAKQNRSQAEGELKLNGRQIPYIIVRSVRKTMALQIKTDGSIWLRVPMAVSEQTAQDMLWQHKDWLLLHYDKILKAQTGTVCYSEQQVKHYRKLAAQRIGQRVQHFARLMQTDYGNITIRQQKTRWGSCSSKGNLNFNWKLVLMPDTILDYVVVHELAHRREMNHSPAFWAYVEQVLPDYRDRRLWLKLHGKEY